MRKRGCILKGPTVPKERSDLLLIVFTLSSKRRVNSNFSNFAAAQLEAALGTFYAPVKPLSEVTVLEYRDPISRLARRFFHHLLRFTRFDKAFLLAVDIGARDLFMVWIFFKLMSI